MPSPKPITNVIRLCRKARAQRLPVSPDVVSDLEHQLIALIRPIMARYDLAVSDPQIPAGHPIYAAIETAMDEAGCFDGGVKAIWVKAKALANRANVHNDVDDVALRLGWNRLAHRMSLTPIVDIADAKAMVDLLEYVDDLYPDWEGKRDGLVQVRAYLARQKAS